MLKDIWIRFKRHILPPFIAFAAKYGMKLLMSTCKVQVTGFENFKNTAATSPCILAIWHNRLTAMTEILSKNDGGFNYTAFVSKSRDGEPLARIVESYPNGKALRVSHHARHQALSQMIQLLKKRDSILMITPDGPRGPCYSVKPGIAMAAQEADATIIPFSWDATKYWRLKSWDKMIFPKPFSTITATFGPGITCPQDRRLEDHIAAIQSALHAISHIK